MRLFVYGTLQQGADTPMARWLATRTQAMRPAVAPGRLLAIPGRSGWYPALVRGAARERCHGTLVQVALCPGDLALLDRYEGREYRRGVVRVRLADASYATATVYRWRLAAPERSEIVPGGDFLEWIERTGRRSFTTRRDRV